MEGSGEIGQHLTVRGGNDYTGKENGILRVEYPREEK